MIDTNHLSEYARIIDECRILLWSIKGKEVSDLVYALTALYSRMLLTTCEIYTLLKNGYSEGAFALSRLTYEAMIIMNFLSDNKDDSELIERFLDDYHIRTCYDHLKYLQWLIACGENNEEINSVLAERTEEYNAYVSKYSDYAITRNETYFPQYWWAGKNASLFSLRKAVNQKDSYLYDLSCYRVHASMANILTLDDSEDGFLLGSCQNISSTPFLFSLLNLHDGTGLFFTAININAAAIILKIENLCNSVEPDKSVDN